MKFAIERIISFKNFFLFICFFVLFIKWVTKVWTSELRDFRKKRMEKVEEKIEE